METHDWNHYIHDKNLTREEVKAEIERIYGVGGEIPPFSSKLNHKCNNISLCVDGPLEGVAMSLSHPIQEILMPIKQKMKLVQYEYSSAKRGDGFNGQWVLCDIIDMDSVPLCADYMPPERFNDYLTS